VCVCVCVCVCVRGSASVKRTRKLNYDVTHPHRQARVIGVTGSVQMSDYVSAGAMRNGQVNLSTPSLPPLTPRGGVRGHLSVVVL